MFILSHKNGCITCTPTYHHQHKLIYADKQFADDEQEMCSELSCNGG
ncbi:hypothetical protein MIDIC_360004 [Alphaproteobacteria bacterium]